MSPVPHYSRRRDPFSMDPLDHLLPLSGPVDHLQPLSGQLDHLRPLSGQLDHLRPLSGPFDHLRPLSGPSDGFRPLCGLFTGVPLDAPPFVQVRMDWRETPTAHVFKADLPGLKKEEVKAEIEGDRMLQISGERRAEKEEMSDTWHRVERSSGKFVRRFMLPENAMVDQVKAAMENGVLTLTVPKEGAKKYDVRSIHITG